ncbi:MAG: SGNH/GDSL hydrolase family protein [Clostridia bacterium]|nr:SGNH/GDSL hydrolase family protein [Clostridia bacterium]
MRLTGKTLKRLTKGAVYFEENKGYFVPYRYSKEQIDYMARPEYDWGWRMYAGFTGGIRLEFKTDSENISFDYRASHSHERGNTVDLYINGVLTSIYKIEDRLKGKVEFTLPAGKKLVTLYLPGESKLEIKNFTLDGGYEAVKDKGQRVLVIGDSITQGAGPDFASASYLNSLQRKTGYTILDQGIGGYRFEAKDLMKVTGFEPDKIIAFLGTNYYECVDTYDYERAAFDFYKRLSEIYPNTKILAITPIFRTRDLDVERFSWCINKIKDACALYPNITVADGLDLMPNVAECLADGVHPNTYGSEMIAQNLFKFIKDNKL